MDFHPLVIHYPIAFLTTYAVFEIVRVRKLLNLPYWFYIKGTLLLLGEVSAFVTLIAVAFSTSALAEESPLADMYILFMSATALIFAISSTFYLRGKSHSYVLVILAILGLISIVIAGGLFGATVYGTQFDPFLAPVFQFLKVY